MNKKELFNAVNEMIDVFGGLKDDDGEEIVINNKTSEEELLKIATEAITIIAEGDEFTEETQAVIDEIKEGQKKPTKKEIVKEPKVKNENQALIDEINEIDTLNALKGIVKTEDVFSSLRKSIATEKNVDVLKEKMLKLLGIGAEEITVEEKKEEVAKPVKKQEKAPVKKVEKEVIVNKEKKEKSPSPYGTAVEIMCENTAISMEDLIKAVAKKGIDTTNLAGITTAYSCVRKISSLLKQNGWKSPK